MSMIDLNKVTDLFVMEIRDKFNIHEKLEIVRILLNSIEYDHNEARGRR